MIPRMTVLATAAIFTLSIAAASSASAASSEAPQVLGLIASKRPAPLNCVDGTCTGFFSAFCMQEKRPKPTAGQQYDLAGAGDLTLVVQDVDGGTTRFSAAGLLEFTSEGEYTSVRVSLQTRRLASLNPKSISVLVPRHVALVPRLPEGVANATHEQDLEIATGPRRFAAEGFFEHSNPRADAAVIMTRLINLLPPQGTTPTKVRHQIWNKSIDNTLIRELTPEGVETARDTYDRCNHYADKGYKVRLRGCLSKSHDELLKSLNKDYWESDAGL
ncbi:MAG: hypothetical protein O3B74_09445 [Proteobacteria bacterium]|nr:hypothetical protein [Pseudomonadota bacterium]